MNVPSRFKMDIAATFSAAADTYDRSADAQRRIAAALAARIDGMALPENPRVLEVGCGTGFLTANLRALLPTAQWLLTDISERMVARCRARFGDSAQVMVMDGERPSCANGAFDLICSSLAFQWFENMDAALARLAALLAPGGRLVFATLADDSFREWRAAYPLARTYPTIETLRRFGDVEEERFTREYPDALAFLDHWRQIGADVPEAGQHPLSPGALRRALRPFEAGIAVTYHVAYVTLTR